MVVHKGNENVFLHCPYATRLKDQVVHMQQVTLVTTNVTTFEA